MKYNSLFIILHWNFQEKLKEIDIVLFAIYFFMCYTKSHIRRKVVRKLGMDFGDARIGLAISDPIGFFATGLETYHRTKNLKADLQYIANLIKQKDVETLVVGLPINMDGTMGIRVDKTREFCSELSKLTNVKIEYSDERLTTVAAEKMLIESDVRREDRKKVIDKVAATMILQHYLDRK